MPAFALDSAIPLPAQPLGDYSWLQRSLFLAQMARAAYDPPADFRNRLSPLTDRVEFWDRGGAQAYWVETPSDCVVAFRGTEPDDWNDWKADLDAEQVPCRRLVGRVHHGFWTEANDLWTDVASRLATLDRPLWLTGHSLGGAIALVTAGYCRAERAAGWLRGIYTFGAPRAGDEAFASAIDVPHYRWVHNNDVVPQLPPAWLGYVHHGRQAYVDRRGRLRQWAGWERWLDRLRGWASGLLRWRIDGIGDHSMERYAASIDAVVAKYAPLGVVPVRLAAPRRRPLRRAPLRRAA